MKRTSTELPLAVVEHVFRNLISEIKKMKGKNADTTFSLCVCARFSIHCSRSVWLSAIVIMRVVKCFCCFYSLCLFFVWLCRVPGVRCRCQIRCGSTLARNRFAGTLEWMHWKFSFHLDLIRQRTRNARAAEIELPKSKSRDRRCSLAVITCYCLPSMVLGLTRLCNTFITAFMQQWIFTGIFTSCLHCLDVHSACREPSAAVLLRRIFFEM